MNVPLTRRDAYDVVIVGGGHNGLTAAAYLAGAGLSVAVLERLDHTGGAAVSAQPFPGFPAACRGTPTWCPCCPTRSSSTLTSTCGWRPARRRPTPRCCATAAPADCSWSGPRGPRPG